MARYIDADRLIKTIFPFDCVDKKHYSINAQAVFDAIKEAPTEEVETKPTKYKQRAIYLGFSNHDCEAWYKCPACLKTFGSWRINIKDVRCPHCKTELDGIS